MPFSRPSFVIAGLFSAVVAVASCVRDDDALAPGLGLVPLPAHAADAALHDALVRLRDAESPLPRLHGDYIYYAKKGEQGRTVHLRRHTNAGSPEELVLDEGALAAGHDFFVLGAFDPSPDNRHIAYSTDTDASERYCLVVKDLESGDVTPVDEDTDFAVAWHNEDLLYSRLDDDNRPRAVFAAAPKERREHRRAPRLVHAARDPAATVLVGQAAGDDEATVFVRSPGRVLGYRLHPGADVELNPLSQTLSDDVASTPVAPAPASGETTPAGPRAPALK